MKLYAPYVKMAFLLTKEIVLYAHQRSKIASLALAHHIALNVLKVITPIVGAVDHARIYLIAIFALIILIVLNA